jgi:hypothetical protein
MNIIGVYIYTIKKKFVLPVIYNLIKLTDVSNEALRVKNRVRTGVDWLWTYCKNITKGQTVQ